MTELVWPNGTTTEPKRSDGYGPRQQYFIDGYWTRKWHTGTDHYDIGTIKSIGAGTVQEVSGGGWAGNQVLVYLGVIAGRKTWVRYCHLAAPSRLKVGQKVKLGDTIGTEGATGQAAGKHLHWEIYRGYVDRGDGSGPAYTVDPRAFIPLYLPKSKGLTVTTIARRDTATPKAPRILKPGEGFWLNTTPGASISKATNLVGNPGPYLLTHHVYFKGEAIGDLLTLTHYWGDKNAANSPHYPQDWEVSREGFLHQKNASFQRAVATKQCVYLRVSANSKNKKPIEIHMLANDAWLIK